MKSIDALFSSSVGVMRSLIYDFSRGTFLCGQGCQESTSDLNRPGTPHESLLPWPSYVPGVLYDVKVPRPPSLFTYSPLVLAVLLSRCLAQPISRATFFS